jgi:hypothetical protein
MPHITIKVKPLSNLYRSSKQNKVTARAALTHPSDSANEGATPEMIVPQLMLDSSATPLMESGSRRLHGLGGGARHESAAPGNSHCQIGVCERALPGGM